MGGGSVPREVEVRSMMAVDGYGAQLISVFLPLGLFCVGVVWLALQRRAQE